MHQIASTSRLLTHWTKGDQVHCKKTQIFGFSNFGALVALCPMFFLIEREDEVALPPRAFTRDIEKKILAELRRKVQGRCTGRFGYTILVKRLEEFGNALLNEDTGWAHFPVKYLALVFGPFKNEVLPAHVVGLNETGLFAEAGPLVIYVSKNVSFLSLSLFSPKLIGSIR
jgi:DNA-directed RNA polymerase subunit E'/Rpb7